MLGYNKDEAKEIEDMARISNNFLPLKEAVERNYYSVKNFWNVIREKTKIRDIDPILIEHVRKYNQEWIHNCMKAAADYIKSLRRLGIYTKNLELSDNGLEYSYRESIKRVQSLFKEYLVRFGKYISYFNPNDSTEFLTKINQSNNLNYWIDLASKYNRYTHTEYMIRYQHGNKSSPLHLISYLDVCENCEQMLAETTPQENMKYNTVVISEQEYSWNDKNKSTRKKQRSDDLTNFSFFQLQLDWKYFHGFSGQNIAPIFNNSTAFGFGKPMKTTSFGNAESTTSVSGGFSIGNKLPQTQSFGSMGFTGDKFSFGNPGTPVQNTSSQSNFGFGTTSKANNNASFSFGKPGTLVQNTNGQSNSGFGTASKSNNSSSFLFGNPGTLVQNTNSQSNSGFGTASKSNNSSSFSFGNPGTPVQNTSSQLNSGFGTASKFNHNASFSFGQNATSTFNNTPTSVFGKSAENSRFESFENSKSAPFFNVPAENHKNEDEDMMDID